MNKIVPNLWFDNCAKEAVEYYVSVFPDGKILSKDFYTESGEDITGHAKGEINAGPEFPFSPSVSFMVKCHNQDEVDYYWEKLSHYKEAEQCGWARDKFGLSWQVVPVQLEEMLINGNDRQRKNVTEAFMQMKKFDIAKLEKAYME
jgi:predicted 3-demethylubiquinone-9 3-methyltransferase (glyoxalase superfamily)